MLRPADVCAMLSISESTLLVLVRASEQAGIAVPRIGLGGAGPGARWRRLAEAVAAIPGPALVGVRAGAGRRRGVGRAAAGAMAKSVTRA